MEEQEESKEQEKKEEVPERKKPLRNMVKWLSVILFIGVVIILILIKVSKPDFPLGGIFAVGIIGLIIFSITFFAFEIPRWIRGFTGFNKEKTDKLPPAITLGQAQDEAERLLKSPRYGNKMKFLLDEGVEEHGKLLKQAIYFLYCEGKYTKDGRPVKYFIGINMHFPKTHKRVIIDPNQNQMSTAKQKLATDPEDSPDTEVIEEKNPMLGTERKIVKTSRKKDETKEIKSGDLE